MNTFAAKMMLPIDRLSHGTGITTGVAMVPCFALSRIV